MNVVLATSPAVEDRHGVKSLPPLSLGYLAACTKEVPGADVKIVDAYGEDLNHEEALERVLALEPDVLGLSSTSFCIRDGFKLLSAVKKTRSSTTCVMGGYHPTFFDNLILKEVPEVDAVVRGEGDLSFRELCRCLYTDEGIDHVPGLSYRSNGEIVRGKPQLVDDLDALPFPDRSSMDYDGYFYQFGGFYLPKPPPAAAVISSRACPYHCTYCPKLFPEWRYRIRSAESLFQEVQELQAQGITITFFQDENFSHNLPRLEKFCRMVIDHNLDMSFAFQGTIHHLNEETFQLMHEAGFGLLFVGVESGSDAQLKRYNKPVKSADIGQAIRNAKKAHMIVISFFIHGGPGETMEDSEATRRFIQEVRPHVAGASELSVQPGTILWSRLVGDGEIQSLKESYPRKISEFPGQHTKENISIRRKGFQRALAKSWRHWVRAKDVIDLCLRNPLIIGQIKRLPREFRSLFQLIMGGPKETRDPRIKRM